MDGGDAAPQPAKVLPDYAATANGVVFGLFPDRLRLPGETIVGKEKLDKTKGEIASRGGTDFVPTIMLDGRDLQAADLSWADLRGVSLKTAAMQGVDLTAARLQGASLSNARLQGATLIGARSESANLGQAQLQGANLSGAQLRGAGLIGAHLQAANLDGAELQGASLIVAKLQGAYLDNAQLQCAYLADAELQGASLDNAQLQGANLIGADLSESSLKRISVFRTVIGGANLAPAVVERGTPVEPLTIGRIESWLAAEATAVPSDRVKELAISCLTQLKDGFSAAADKSDSSDWDELTAESHARDPDGTQHRHRLATVLGDLACSGDGAPYVARGLIRPPLGLPPRLAALGDQLDAVRTRIEEGRKTRERCPGVAGFTEEDWHQLEAIKPAGAAPANH